MGTEGSGDLIGAHSTDCLSQDRPRDPQQGSQRQAATRVEVDGQVWFSCSGGAAVVRVTAKGSRAQTQVKEGGNETEHTEAGQALGGHSAAQCKFLLQATDSRAWLSTMLEMVRHAYPLPLRATILFLLTSPHGDFNLTNSNCGELSPSDPERQSRHFSPMTQPQRSI